MSSALNRALQPVNDGLSKRNFDRLAAFIYDYSGIKMPPTKLTMLEGRLRRRLRATAQPSLDAYCDFLFKQGGLEQETVYLIDAVTTNKTDFFREPNHFTYMTRQALPDLQRQGVRTVRAWSSACSTGAEPYTMAMVLSEFIGDRTDMNYAILATDLSTEVLQAARRGIYASEMVEPVPPDLRQRYVMRAREISGEMIITAPCFAACEIASTLSNRFGIIIGRKKWTHQMQSNVHSYGHAERLAGFYDVGLGVDDFQKDHPETNRRLLAAGRKAVEDGGAESLILGCTMEIGFYKELERELGVPVIDPSIAALKRAEYAAILKRQCGWVPSRKGSCESPTEEEMARFDAFGSNAPVFGSRIVVEAA